MKKVLTIAGSDPSGGAGIQADLKTFAAHGVYGMSVLTALTAQNTRGVSGVHAVPPEFVAAQLEAVLSDIRPDAVKIGMVANAAIVAVIAESLERYKLENIVVDPVMVATSGDSLLEDAAVDAIIARLFPLATLITPNIPEAKRLGRALEGYTVLLKGGHDFNNRDNADDVLHMNTEQIVFPGKRIDTRNTHGTGCTLSSAIACNLAKQMPLETAVQAAKDYVTRALTAAAALELGGGNGPLWHGIGT
ncbi:MAG: bifunctional hydroxymethylpyrimidine kinase/phosphomethylpyrimidine kinase [Oscillospiraceae bacterium]|nr:bifunctional hydroxymethylpyrimidine kinase/phosphomethylpyrimidine kinase [Oscillospiraceae bacterium]